MITRRFRVALGGATGLLWLITIITAMTELHMKMYMVIWLATWLVSLFALAVWFTRGDHQSVARIRTRVELARLQAALGEEYDDRSPEARSGRWVRGVA